MNVSNRLVVNALLSVCQVIIVGLSYFIIFRIILNSLGEDVLGIWTLVFSVSSVSNIANLGISASLVKFVATYYSKQDYVSVNQLLYVSLVIVGTIMAALAFLILFLGDFLLEYVLVNATQLNSAKALLPFSLLSFWLNTVGAIFLSVLDGMIRTYVRNIIYIVSSIIFCICSYLVIGNYGIIGVSIAQIMQGTLIIIMAIIALKKYLPNFDIVGFHWSKKLFKEIFAYSVNFQVISILTLLTDPVTKFFLSSNGSLSAVGYFEMANRLVIQVRQLIVTANQTIIPWIAQKSEKEGEIISIYIRLFQLVSFISIPLMALIIIQSPIISLLWIGHYEPFFVFSVVCLGIAYTTNIACGPAYFSNMGTGHLKPIIVVNLIMAIANVGLGWIGGFFFHSYGVVLGWSVSLMISSMYLIFLFRKQYKIPVNIYDKYFFKLLFTYIFSITTMIIFFQYLVEDKNIVTVSILALFIFLGITVSLNFKHPIIKILWYKYIYLTS
jgi:O-antigen/teichoic acid export membrane protein